MAKKKNKKSASEGSVAGSIVLGVISAAVGALLGIVSLSTVSVTEVRDLPPPDKIEPDTIYYVSGKERGGSYDSKERAFLEGRPGAIRLAEADLNRWASNTFKFAKPKPGEEAGGLLTMRPSAPNFRIADGKLHIGMMVETVAFGESKKIRFQTEGEFVSSGGEYVFQPRSTYLGSAHLPPAGFASMVSSMLLSPFRQSEQYTALSEAWRGLSQVAIDGDTLVLVRQ